MIAEREVTGATSFNEAPIHESGKLEAEIMSAIRAAVASMRPRFMNRGSVWTSFGRSGVPPASMRPRFMNRGSNNYP